MPCLRAFFFVSGKPEGVRAGSPKQAGGSMGEREVWSRRLEATAGSSQINESANKRPFGSWQPLARPSAITRCSWWFRQHLPAHLPFFMPVATPSNSIIFGTGKVSIRKMFRVGLALEIIGVIVITTAIFLLGPILGIDVSQFPAYHQRKEKPPPGPMLLG